jgi:3-hydroxyacyl-[acyl-carrier-protein] dehydratase
MIGRPAILAHLPQGDGFVFVDSAEVEGSTIRGSYTITGREIFAGMHFPGRFVFPASIMMEAIGQLGIVYLAETMGGERLDPASVLFIGSEDVACRRPCAVGERLDMRLQLKRKREPLIVFSGTIQVGDALVLKVSSLSLSFSTQSSG